MYHLGRYIRVLIIPEMQGRLYVSMELDCPRFDT